MTLLERLELLSYLVTIFGLPLAIFVFVYEQRRERRNEDEEIFQKLSDEYREFLKLVLDNADLKLLRRDGVELHVGSHVSGLPVYAGRSYVPAASEIRDALARAISAGVKAYNVAAFCTKIGLGPTSEDYGEPMASKATYVGCHAMHADMPKLLKAARATLVEFDDVELRSIVEAAAGGKGTGVKSPPKNLIFAANGPKPELVLRDAISNDIEITKNAEFCLVYARPLTDEGLSWQDLTDWWDDTRADAAERDVARDLYYRLNVVNLWLPPLRERGDDVLIIAKALLSKYADELGSQVQGFSPQALAAIKKHPWPGNIRQLENRIRKALVLCDKALLSAEDLDLGASSESAILPLEKAKEEFQRKYVLEVLERNNGNRTQTARDLGVDPRTIFRYLEREANPPPAGGNEPKN